MDDPLRILVLEPFLGGSHAAFVDALQRHGEAEWTVLGMPARHWKWRMRGAAMFYADEHRATLEQPWDVVLASSYLPLAELAGLVPRFARVPRVLYFHENQWAYPVRPEHSFARDQHFGFTQLVSAGCADLCIFNSTFNRDTFLAESRAVLARMPDARPHRWVDKIVARSEVLGVPIDYPVEGGLRPDPPTTDRRAGPLLLWNQRWEHDKNPEGFFAALADLVRSGVSFRVAVCGERFAASPAVFEQARATLGDRVVHWGFASREEYARLLGDAQIVVSTAHHEFFGVAVLEAVHAGARPLVPDRLAYPELVDDEFRYADEQELIATLRELCGQWINGAIDLRADRREITQPYAAAELAPRYVERFAQLAAAGGGDGSS